MRFHFVARLNFTSPIIRSCVIGHNRCQKSGVHWPSPIRVVILSLQLAMQQRGQYALVLSFTTIVFSNLQLAVCWLNTREDVVSCDLIKIKCFCVLIVLYVHMNTSFRFSTTLLIVILALFSSGFSHYFIICQFFQ